MAKDDMRVIACKLLTYLYECIKAGGVPSEAKARELAGCNAVYWCAVLDDLMKGSSGQAVQCMNRVLSLPEEIGLETLPFN